MNSYGYAAFHIAKQNDHVEVVQVLLGFLADVNNVNIYWCTSLAFADALKWCDKSDKTIEKQQAYNLICELFNGSLFKNSFYLLWSLLIY